MKQHTGQARERDDASVRRNNGDVRHFGREARGAARAVFHRLLHERVVGRRGAQDVAAALAAKAAEQRVATVKGRCANKREGDT